MWLLFKIQCLWKQRGTIQTKEDKLKLSFCLFFVYFNIHDVSKNYTTWADTLKWLYPLVNVTHASSLLRRLSIWFFNLVAETCSHSATTELVRSNTDVGRHAPAHSRCSSWSHSCWMELMLELRAGQTQTEKTLSLWTWLCVCGHCWNEKGLSLVVTKLEAHCCLKKCGHVVHIILAT